VFLNFILKYKYLIVFKQDKYIYFDFSIIQEGIKNKDYIPSETSFYFDTLSLLDRVLLPTLSLAEGSSISEHLWTLLQLYPYHCRYF